MMDDGKMGKPGQSLNGAARQRPTPRAAGSADAIATGLQQLFASVAEEPVPDEFMALLDRIEAAERARDTSDSTPPASNGERGA